MLSNKSITLIISSGFLFVSPAFGWHIRSELTERVDVRVNWSNPFACKSSEFQLQPGAQSQEINDKGCWGAGSVVVKRPSESWQGSKVAGNNVKSGGRIFLHNGEFRAL